MVTWHQCHIRLFHQVEILRHKQKFCTMYLFIAVLHVNIMTSYNNGYCVSRLELTGTASMSRLFRRVLHPGYHCFTPLVVSKPLKDVILEYVFT